MRDPAAEAEFRALVDGTATFPGEPYPTLDDWTAAIAATKRHHIPLGAASTSAAAPRSRMEQPMTEKKPEPKAGDPCPQCGDAFVEHRAPTAEERKFAEHPEHRRPYPARVDTATAEQRAELGALYECNGCGYRTRIKPDVDDAPAKGRRKRADAEAAAAGSSKE